MRRVPDETSAPLSRVTLAALAAPSVSLAALSMPLVVYLPAYYAGTLGLHMTVVGAVFMVVRLLDIGFDPLIGGIMDHTRTRFGRFRPWLALGAPTIMLGMVMLFTARPGVGPGFLAIGLGVAYAGWSILALAQLSLAATSSPDYAERSRIYAWWQAAFMIGLIAVMLVPKVVDYLGYHDARSTMVAMAGLVVVLTPILTSFTFFRVRERAPPPASRRGSPIDYLRLIGRKDVRIAVIAELLLGLAAGTTTTLALFFFTATKGIAAPNVGLILMSQWFVALPATPVWTWIANRFGKHRALALAALLSAAAQLLLFAIPFGSALGAFLIFSLIGLSYGAIAVLPRAMMADCADAERLESGVDRTGLMFAVITGTWKVGQAVAVGILFTALDVIGFNPAASASNPPATLRSLQLLYCLAPMALSVVACAFVLRYPLTAERHRQIRAQLDANAG
ncbi:MAG: hypothetical protein JWQ29_3165, partial [Phenylobacterium sp.]|nr:hypothetical protein [Phenylobacterium sp.]